MNERIRKINSLIKKHISEIFTKNLSMKPGIFLTVSKVDTSPDLRYTRIFVSIFPEKETNYATETLKKELFSIQKELNKKLHMKIIPKIQFKIDTTGAEADEIEKILRDLEY